MTAVLSLSEAVGALARLENARRPTEPPERIGSEADHTRPMAQGPAQPRREGAWRAPPTKPPPAPGAFASPTACMQTYLPPVELPDRALDFVCEHTEFWSAEERTYRELAHRRGEGAKLWRQLGPYAMAALAMMRRGCCPDAEPLLAVVPGLWCGILRDRLRAFDSAAWSGPVQDYEETLRCLFERGVHLPERWGNGLGADAREAFFEFGQRSRER